MQELFQHTIHRSDAIFPILALLIKGATIGAKKHGIKKIVSDSAKEVVKDKIKDITTQEKDKKQESGEK